MKTLKEAKKRLLQKHYEAGVGHIGGNLSCLEILFAIVQTMKYPGDQIIISKGHAAGAWYVIQWAFNSNKHEYNLKTFHKDGTNLAGHLPNTGSLGHGLGLAAGMALHKKLWNESGIVYCLMSDGEWDEGSNWEAIRFINANYLWQHLKIVIDVNRLQGFKLTDDYWLVKDLRRYDYLSCGCNGHDIQNLTESLKWANLVFAYTIKGHGVSFLENKLESHYDPLTFEQYQQALLEVDNAEDVC